MSTEQYIILFWKKHSYLIGYFDNKHIEESKVTAVFECVCSKNFVTMGFREDKIYCLKITKMW